MKIINLIFMMVALVGAGTTQAANPSQPQVEYSADTLLETAEISMTGHINYTPTRERREMVAEGGDKMIMIMRHDKKLAWTLMPAESMYMESSIAEANSQNKSDPSQFKIEQTVVGPEMINGVNTTKSKIIMTGAKGEKMGGFMWMSKENIMVKIDAISIDKNEKMRFKNELADLKVGKQDPALFEIPRGFEKMGMPGMGGGFNMKDLMNQMK